MNWLAENMKDMRFSDAGSHDILCTVVLHLQAFLVQLYQ